MKTAVYAGSFDPITNGHLWMVTQGANIFDKLIVAIGNNPDKKFTFSLDERMSFLAESTQGIVNVEFDHIPNQFLVDYAAQKGADYILRGIRNEQDFLYEQTMRNLNRDFDPAVETVFLMPPRELAEVSSSLVRGLVGIEGWEERVRKLVPDVVYKTFEGQYGSAR